jgi:hypothetical protein
MGKRAELEIEAIRLYADGMEIPAIAQELGVSINSLRDWKKRAGNEWDEARKAARKDQIVAIEDVASRLRRSREITSQLTGDAKRQGAMGMVLNETLQTMMYDMLGQMQTLQIEDMPGTVDMVNRMTLALARTEQSAVLNLKKEKEIRKQALTDAADAVEKAAVQQGLNTEQAAFWRQQVLGVQ